MRMLRIGLVAGLFFASFSLSLPDSVSAAAGDIGIEGPSYTGASADPTGEKPESKTWFNDGSWWGSLWDTASGRYEIFRFNVGSGAWTSTNVPLDTRSNSRADTLWDGTKLYVASHVFSESPATGYPSRLYRFSYSGGVYSLDVGWPQDINTFRSESLVIDKDSSGQLWATWAQGASGSREVWVNRTTSGDSTWGAPFELPVNNTGVANDDISSVIAFGGNKIGVFWSNQKGSSFHFAVHDDAAADTSWSPSVGVFPGSGNADDHINLKSLQTDGSGRVFAVVKTSKTNSADPSIVLLVRSSSAVWSAHTVWTKGNDLTRAIVILDTSNSRIHAFASKESGGPVYTKTSLLSSIGFASGLGTTVMLDASHSDINNVTSTKQTVSSATGLLVLASNQSTKRYWHHFDSLGGGGGGSAPVANFSGSPTSGDAPLTVNFTDSSTNTPTSWAWDFDNNGTTDSVLQNPSFSYASAGTYTVKLTATNGSGFDSETKTNYISVGSGGGGGEPVTATPDADTYVNSGSPTTTYGSASTFRTRGPSPQLNSFLRFTVSGVGAADSATLRLWVHDASPDAGKLHRVASNTWSESLTFADQPAPGSLISDIGAVSAGAYRDIDVSSYVTGDGTYSFAIIGEVSDAAIFHSREGANDPQLVVTPSGGGGGGNATPVCSALSLTTAQDGSGDEVAPSCTDADGDTLSYAIASQGSKGVASVTATNQLRYVPNSGQSGADSFTYTASDGTATSSPATVSVTITPSGGGGTPVTATPDADTYVRSDSTSTFGTQSTLRSRGGGSLQINSYLRFTIAGVGATSSSEVLRLYVSEVSIDGGKLHQIADDSWSESMLYTGQPTLGPLIVDLGALPATGYVDIPVGSYVNGDGVYSFAIIGENNDVAQFHSKEGANDPQLVVTP